ncbi:MAG TPA: thermonuclease family protein [Candidatus Dojkabacteria bacterium]|nr:thermonuclease family protein [Candidatus Dojkabacteria bacterium]HRO65749.1 thermonuclease family protein [Candidatus Dojkabacteria bacterium]HRP51840.1 thermonuclease family protein [Candidatus Dojkabacteria bacterium]
MNTISTNRSLVNTIIAIFLLIFAAFISDSKINPNLSRDVLGTDTTLYNVTSIVDGDTIKVSDSQEQFTVRLIGIDTPETKDPRKEVECFGEEATLYLTKLLDDNSIILKSDSTQDDVDRYGRLLRYAFLQDGTNVNKTMIQDGYAYEYTYSKPYYYQKEFIDAQHFARNGRLGLWSGVCD